jgi:hypothetical protein
MNLTEIKENLKKGLTNGYKQNLLLLSSYNSFIDQVQEYLLTVNVAQQLLEWNKHHTHRIQIEYPAFHFYNNAFVAYEWDVTDIFDMAIIQRQSGHSPTDKLQQKIDIAITQEQNGSNASTHERTLSGIELKGINKSQAEIISDAKRMSNAMLLTDKVSSNSIEFCFCGFLRRFDKVEEMVTDTFIQQKTQEELKHWAVVCSNLATDYPTLDFTIENFDIINTPLEEVSNFHKKMDSDYSEVANDTGTVVGYILTIHRK